MVRTGRTAVGASRVKVGKPGGYQAQRHAGVRPHLYAVWHRAACLQRALPRQAAAHARAAWARAGGQGGGAQPIEWQRRALRALTRLRRGGRGGVTRRPTLWHCRRFDGPKYIGPPSRSLRMAMTAAATQREGMQSSEPSDHERMTIER